MWTRQQLKERAKNDLHRSYWGLVLVSFIMLMIGGSSGGGGSSTGRSSDSASDMSGGGFGGIDWGVVLGVLAVFAVIIIIAIIVGMALGYFVFIPLQIGAQRFFIEAAYEQKTVNDMDLLGMAFGRGKSTYLNVVKVMFFKGLYEGLWTLLFIVPGVIKAYEYRMIPYILAENPDVDVKDAFLYSREMMDGEKWNAFVLDLSFIGWGLLSTLTCGILGIFYVNPYVNMTNAELYHTLKHRASGNYYDAAPGGDAYTYGNPGAYSADAPFTDSDISGAPVSDSDISGDPVSSSDMDYYKPTWNNNDSDN